MSNFFAGIRKEYVADHNEAHEVCLHCQSLGIENTLRYFYINLDEAIWKCSNSTCFYPFDNFKFKNFKDNTVYIYQRIAEECPMKEEKDAEKTKPSEMCNEHSMASVIQSTSVKDSPENSQSSFEFKDNFALLDEYASAQEQSKTSQHVDQSTTINEFDFDNFAMDFFNTDSPENSQSSIELKEKFDLLDENASAPDQSKASQHVDQQLNLNEINDMLDDIINEYSSESFDTSKAVTATNRQVPSEKVAAVVIERPTINLVKESNASFDKNIEIPRPKLTKCLKYIEAKVRIKKEKTLHNIIVNREKFKQHSTSKIESPLKNGQIKSTTNLKLALLKRSPIKTDNVNSALISLVAQREHFKPLAILNRLKSLDFSRTSNKTLNEIIQPFTT